MIEVININHSFSDIKIFNNLSLSIKEEGITVISGPNGSGKTTLLKIISKILIPDSGIVKIPNAYKEEKDIGFIFQKPILLKRNVYENLSFILKKNGISKYCSHTIINKYLNKLLADNKDLENFLERNIFELSGGEQQIISLIRTIATKPKLLFLDEPFTNLDDMHCEALCSLLSDISNNGSKIIMVTHKHDIAKKLSMDIISL